MDDALKGNSRPPRFNWIRRHKKATVVISIIVFIILGAGVASAIYFLNRQPEPAPAQAQTPEPEPVPPPVYYSQLTGNKVASEADITAPVTGVMIENSPDSRPQSGLKNSGVVFEAIAEGGITRFLVLYQREKPKLIGPVRSVRIYYIDWLAPFNASIAHVGGSPEALREVRNGKYRDIDQFFNSAYYWRATDRYAPHNVYTNFEKLDALNKAKKYKTSKFTGFTRKDSEAAEKPKATKIDVTISGFLYNSSYKYDKKSNTYLRSQAGAAHKDRESGQIRPRVVIGMMVDMGYGSDGYHQAIDTSSKGTAYVFQDGTVNKVTWEKKSRTKQITFSKNGEDFPLARGQTWITAVPKSSGAVEWE